MIVRVGIGVASRTSMNRGSRGGGGGEGGEGGGGGGGGGGGAKPLFCQKLIFFFSRWSPLKRGTIAWRKNRTFVSTGTPVEVATLIKGISHFFFFCIW